ncbi:hypothetical protein VULLAG_LOCUS17557 [Vulpes lagopus]
MNFANFCKEIVKFIDNLSYLALEFFQVISHNPFTLNVNPPRPRIKQCSKIEKPRTNEKEIGLVPPLRAPGAGEAESQGAAGATGDRTI